MTTTEQYSSEDPFSAENAPGLNLMMNMRIYDLLLALLTTNNPQAAQMILDAHAKGEIFSAPPFFAAFVNTSDEVVGKENEETSPSAE